MIHQVLGVAVHTTTYPQQRYLQAKVSWGEDHDGFQAPNNRTSFTTYCDLKEAGYES